MRPYHVTNLKSAPTFIRFISYDRLAIVTQNGTFRILNSSNLKQLAAFKTDTARTKGFSKTSLISKTGNRAVYLDRENKQVNIVDITSMKRLGTFNKHDADITCLATDNDDLYLASGGEDGKVFLHSADTGKFLFKLPSHPDYVSIIGFSFDGNYLISGAYDGSIVINNISTAHASIRIKIFDKAKISAMLFLPDFQILLGNEHGEIALVDYLKHKTLKRLSVGIYAIEGFLRGFGGRMMFTMLSSGRLALIDLNKFEPVTLNLDEFESDIMAMGTFLKKNLLVVGLANGKLLFHRVHEAKELATLIDSKEYEKAYNTVLNDKLLLISDEYLRLETIWDATFQKAIKLLSIKKTEAAQQILEPFSQTQQKGGTIKKLLGAFQLYPKLERYIESANYSAAYSLVQQYPPLQKSLSFLQLEKIWKERYTQAKEMVLMRNNPEKAKQFLAAFIQVQSKSAIIHTLIRNPNVYTQMSEFLKKKDFKAFFALILRHKFLKETPEYQNVCEYGHHLLENIRHNMKNRHYENVLEVAQQLVHFKHLEHEIQDVLEFAHHAKRFLKMYENGELSHCFQLLDEVPKLSNLHEAKEIEEQWRNLIRKAETNAYSSDISHIREIFQDYFHLPVRNQKIGIILRRTYLNQIVDAIEKNSFDRIAIERAIRHYILLFGYDDGMEEVIVQFQTHFSFDLMLEPHETNKDHAINWYEVTKGNIPESLLR
jgi:hypothetical protein